MTLTSVETVVGKAQTAQAEIETASQITVDELITGLAWAILEPKTNRSLAEQAVRDTGLGNVDDKIILSSIIQAILKSNIYFIFPVHPRTLKHLKEFNLYEKLKKSKNVLIIPSVGYFEILELMKKCLFILTDSGGLQEESTASSIRKKVLVVRKTTDRPESTSSDLSEIVGVNPEKILRSINKTLKNPKIESNEFPFGNGNSTEKILKILNKRF